ncbi:hypothetical protein J2Y45_004157 [Dyadobacter sp. BE34]|uniref:Secretion system C-terminal sorting domain-containing protein n=1 Tax=Dyadobacter fermentans TaxID=94254 RepID=A0ABU1R314_9BACT|nr:MULTISPECIES: T9SS type A sorting domain-containing protein [Dyadobacter]MDR6806965.1 hypothetical protein [Dyadobacter fermentans]MDR7044707.1 hypothetical protein [Dyadobacter sp. BE242]MDR7199017.1 hypothetical protein [Dyadobacter sp. BE34]MDR7216979.1 hypothetical protein [Dyadobacter sp. BE31]MDR7263495.1 hypothetical protein [Dyadobacter sp. BE32]
MKKKLFIKFVVPTVKRWVNRTRTAGFTRLPILCCFSMLWLNSVSANAQDVGQVWIAEAGLVTPAAQAIPQGGVTDAAGNTYMIGRSVETVDFDPGPGVSPLTAGTSGQYAYIQKLDKNKNLVWVKQISATFVINTSAIAVDASGNLVITGSFRGTADFNPGGGVAELSTRVTSGTETFILKLDSNGNYSWAVRLADVSAEVVTNGTGNDIKTDGAGNIYVAGNFSNTVDFNPGSGVSALTSAGGWTDSYVLKLAPDGTFIWARRMGGPLNDNGTTLDVDGNGNVFVGGTVNSNSGASDFGPFTVPATTTQTGFVTKLDGAGTFQWVKTIANTGSSSVSEIEADNAGNIYIGGNAGGTMDLDPGPGTTDIPAAGFITKWDGNGNYVWGMFQGNAVGDITLDNAGNLLATGRYTNAAAILDRDWDPGAGVVKVTNRGTAIASTDIFVSKYTTDAGFVWIKTAGGAAATLAIDDGLSVGVDAAGDIYAAGTYLTDALFGPCKYAVTPTANANIRSQYVWKLSTQPVPNLQFAATTLSPASQQACILGIPQVINASPATIVSPSGYSTTMLYQWQIAENATGPWADMPGEVFKDLQPLARNTSAYYRRIVKVNDGFCGFKTVDSSQVASVIIGTDVSPIANADGPQWFVCGPGSNTVQLAGTASGGTPSYTYQWYEGSTSNGTPLASTGTWTTPGITQATTYTLQVTDAAGCVDIDQVTIVPAIANAGTDKSICQGAGGVQIGVPPVSSPSVSYVWTSISGNPVSSLSCTTCAQPIANPTATTVYRLTVTVQQKGGGTCVTTDDVTVTPVTAPNGTLAFAGTDKTICKNTSVTLGGTADATFAYTWTSGQYLSASQVANPVFNAGTAAVAGGAINYTVSAIKGGCAFTDEVKVSVLNSRITDQDETVCGPIWSRHMDEQNAPGATYSWSVVSGDGTILQTANAGQDAYLKSNSGVTVFRRTVTLNGVTCSADVSVQPCTGSGGCDFEIVTLSDQACPKVFGAVALKLGTSIGDPSNYNFSWSPANLVDNASVPTVNITSTAQATITVTITNKYDGSISCQKSIVINPPGWSLPVFTAQDKYTCPGTSVQIGSTAVAGFTYLWDPATGLSSSTAANPTATVNGTTQFRVAITETASGCRNRDTLMVNVSAPAANAGNDRAVCNGATVTLGSPAPAGTNWTYAWEPSNAAWTNGTGPTDAQPQIQFAAASPQSFIVTVTDPLSGCMDKDTVVLSNTVTTGEYAGAAVTTCQGEPAQLGRSAEPFAQYEWFMADGVTPATGLSSNTAANPTVLSPSATATYVVKVSYPGCSTPLTDQVTLTVNPVTGLDLIDQNVCPAGPVAIGYGAAGNPAAPVGATYLWVPATGLSSATAANPTATVTSETIYSVTVTLPSGCVFTDQVKVSPSANAGSDATLCPGESAVIGTPAIAGATYSWTGASIVGAANVAQPTVKPTVTTTYTVSVTLNGCTTTDQVIVTVNTPNNFNITGNTAICEGGIATLSLAGTAPANSTWQWSPVAGVSSPNATSTTIAATTTQTYRLTQTNTATGCSNYKEVVVVVNPNTIAATTGDLALCEGTSAPLPLNVTSSGSYSYVWSPAVGLSNAFVANPTVTTGSPRTYTVTVTDNASQCQLVKQVNVAINAPEACFAPVTLTGNVFHDANALKDVTVNSTANNPAIPTGLYVTLVDSTGAAVKTVPVNADGTYDFGVTAPGDYSIVLHQTSTGSTTPSLPVGWVNTGENLGAGVGSDAGVNGILTGVTVAGTNVTNANFGIQLPPVTTGGTEPTQPNPGGTTTVDLTSHFGLTDSDGTVASVTFTEFPADATTITINGTTYVAPGATPGAGQQVWPAGNLTVPGTGLSVVVDPVDGGAVVEIPFFVTDNGGLESNVSTVTADFTVPTVQLSGNVFHDANALADSTVNTTGSVTTIPAGLYVSLIDSTGAVVATVLVNADGTYDFGNVEPGTYSVVLHQTAAGSTVPNLPTGWNNTGEHLGANAGSDGTVNGILPNIVVTSTDVTNANFGVQQPPVTTDENLPSSPNPGGTVTVDISGDFNFTDPDGTVETITFTQFPQNVTTVTINGTTYVAPGQTPGAGQQAFPDSGVTVPVTGLEVLVDPIDGNPTVDVPFTVTDNGGLESNESSVTKPFSTPVVSLSGNVFHDANALADSTVNTTGSVTTIPAGLYVSLVDSTGAVVATVPVNADGSYDFGNIEPGTYSVILHQTAAGSTVPSLPTGWNNTGEHLGANAGSDGTVNGILPNIVVTSTDVTNANFGVQQPPVTTDENLPSSPNPGGTTTVDISDDFNFTDPDGTVQSITFTQFPQNVTTVTINGTTYVAPGQTPGAGQQVFPDSGVTVPVTGLEVLVDPIDGNPTVDVPFTVTDNGGLESNESSVTKPFSTPVVSLSGNVFHDANALTDSTVNTTGSVTTIPAGLYVSLIDSTGAVVATVPVNSDGTYDFGNVEPGTYSVVLHQTAAGSTVPSLPTGWNNTGEHLGANAGSDGTVNGILPNIVVTSTDVTNANFGVQQPPVAVPKEYVIDQPVTDVMIPLNGSHVSTGTGTTTPDQLTGADPEDGTLNGDNHDRTVVITTLPDHGELYYNGVLVTAGQVIPDYNPDSLAIKLTGTGYTSTTFEYAYVDEAGEQSPPAPYTIRWEKPLPVTLVSFTATARENAAELNWATSEETNSERFEVQRSIDGKAWKAIGSVQAQGESKVRKTYTFADNKPETGENLYRLRMVDRDSTFAYSAIRSVRFESKLESSIYPNPVADELNLKVTSWKQVKAIRIDNLAGLQVYSSGPVAAGKVDVSKLDSGVYILRITHTDGSVHTHKFVHIQ